MRSVSSAVVLVAVIVLCSASLADAQRDRERRPGERPEVPERLEADIGVEYDEGDFGTSETTRTLALPFSLRYLGDRFDVGVSSSFLYVESSGGVTFFEDVPTSTGTPSRGREVRGFGDLSIKGRYYLTDDGRPAPWVPALSPFVKVKLPTGDESKGLSSGKADVALGMEFDKDVGPVFLFGDVRYTFIGERAHERLDDRPSMSFGVGRDLTRAVTLSAAFDWRRAIARGEKDDADIDAMIEWRITRVLKLSADVFGGLTEGAPDFGGGVHLTYRFGRW